MLKTKKFIILLFQIFIIVFSFSFLFYIYVENNYPCLKIKKYSIGFVEDGFDIKKEDIIKIAKSSESLWEKETKENFFQYEKDSGIKINFVYDKRQGDYNLGEIKKTELTKIKNTLEGAKKVYQDSYEKYKKNQEKLTISIEDFKKQRKVYENSVYLWNKNPTEFAKYSKLKKTESILTKRLIDIKESEIKLDLLYTLSKKRESEYKVIIKKHNKKVNEINKKNNVNEIFTQGNFDSKDINVFYFRKKEELRILLAHEFGHVLGLDHIDDKKSLMYFSTQEESFAPDFEISTKDKEALQGRCNIDTFFYKIKPIYFEVSKILNLLNTFISKNFL